ncbi:MAG: hypothetical protein AAGE65_09600 [Planctomycetota bacterium]
MPQQLKRRTENPRPRRGGAIAWAAVALSATPAHAADFFWSATEDVFGWFDRETPNGPPGFSPWQLSGGGLSGQAPDDVSDTATFGLTTKTTTYSSSITIDRATLNGGELQINGGTLTTINGVVLQGTDAELSFTGGTLNNSAAPLTITAGTVRQISGTSTLSSDVTTAGGFVIGGGGRMNFNRAGGSFSQTAGSFDVLSGGTVDFVGNGYNVALNGGTVTNDGTVSIRAGSVVGLGGAAFTNNNNVTLGSGSTVTVSGGSLNNAGPNASFDVAAGSTFNHNGGVLQGNAIRLNGGALNLNVPLGAAPGTLGSPSFHVTASSAFLGDIHRDITVRVGEGGGVDALNTTGDFENRGTLILDGVTNNFSALGLQGDATITNTGTFRAAFGNAGSFDRRINSNSAGVFDNRPGGQLIVEPGVQLTADVGLTSTGNVDIGVGGSLIFGSNDRFDLEGGTLNNQGTVEVGGGSGPSVFRYAGGTITGNPIAYRFGQVEFAGGSGAATHHFLAGNNDTSGDVPATQTLIVDAATQATTLRRGNNFAGDFSFTNHGAIRLTGADPNDAATFSLAGGTSVMTHTGTLHAQGVPGSSNVRAIGGTGGATVASSGIIQIDPDTTLNFALVLDNTGDIHVGAGGTLNLDLSGARLTHDAGTINNAGRLVTRGFAFNGGAITGNPIEVRQGSLTLSPGTGSASFLLHGGSLAGDVRSGQSVEVRNDTANNTLTDTPGPLTNDGTLILGGNGTGGNTLRVGGIFQNLTLLNQGDFHARNDDPFGNGGQRTLNGRLDNRATTVVEAGATFSPFETDNRGAFTVAPGGEVDLFSGRDFFQNAGTLENQGDFTVRSARFEFNGGAVTGHAIELEGGTLVLGLDSDGGKFVLRDGGGFGGSVGPNTEVRFVADATGNRLINGTAAPGDIDNAGTLVLDESAGGTIDLRTAQNHTVEASGRLLGSGRISFQVFPGTLTNRGEIAPGLDPIDPTGTIAVAGRYTQEANGTLAIDLGGTGAGAFDRLTATSSVTLAGTLELALADGYTPTLGDTLTVLTGSSVAGAFTDVLQPAFMPAGLIFETSYLSNAVELSAVAAPVLPGDYNDSGQVEQGDLNLVLNNWGQPAPFAPNGDPFATSNVDQEELNRVLNNWGSTAAPSFEGSGIPEPKAALMFAVFMLRPRYGLRTTGSVTEK